MVCTQGDNTTLRADRDKEIALADADLQRQLTGNESAHTTAVNNANSAHSTATANAQAAYSTSRSSAHAAHDAAMLDAIEDWQGAISTATLNSLVTSSNATRDYTNSLTEHGANWSVTTAGKTGEAPDTPQASMVDSIIGILNPFDSVNAAEMVAPNNQANATPGSRRPNPSEINVVYSIYGIVSEHTPEEWEVIREHQNRDRSISRWFVDDEQKRMKDAGFKLSFRHLDEGAPPPKIPAPSVFPSAPPILPATPAPAEQPSDDTIPIPDSEPQSGLGITDTIIGVFGGTRRDYVDQTFNFLYGVGDNMSLGIGWWLRSTFFDDQADYGGSSYYIGSWVGFIADLAIGGAFKSLGKVFGKELLEQGARNGPVSIARGGSGTNRWWFNMPEGVPPNGPSRFGDEYKNIWRDNPDMPAFSPLTGRHAGEIGVRPDMSSRVRQFWYDHESGHAALTNALRFNSLQQVRKEWYNLRGLYTAAE